MKKTKMSTFTGVVILAAFIFSAIPLVPPPTSYAATTFTLRIKNTFRLNATSATGGGTITSDDGVVNCSGDCSYTYNVGATIKLSAQPNADKVIGFWGGNVCAEGAFSYSGSVCTLNTSIYASGFTYESTPTFYNKSTTVIVQPQGNGKGTVSGTGLQCGATCIASIPHGTQSTFTATPAAGSTFVGWTFGPSGALCTTPQGNIGSSTTNPSSSCTVTIRSEFSNNYLRPEFALIPTTTTTPSATTNVSPQRTATTTQTQTQTQENVATTLSLEKPVAEFKLGGKTYESAQKLSFSTGEAVTFEGKTFPKANVKLYIFSTPREATVTADENGVWQYSISGLEVGAHRVEAEVVKSDTGEVSTRAVLANFTVAASETAAVANNAGAGKASISSPTIIFIAAVIVVVLSIIAGAFWLIRRHRRRNSNTILPTKPSDLPPTMSVQ